MSDEPIAQPSSCHPRGIPGIDEYSGWLKKLGGKFKTWRKRFFVLRGNKLSYYTAPDELRLLGQFSLQDTQVEALNGDNEANTESKGYLFVVKPENPTAFLTPTHQQFILSASSPEERRSWMRAIRKILYLKQGGALFGSHLSEVFPFTRREYGYHPRVVHDTTQFIRDYGMETEGIFRKCGTLHALQELAEAYDVVTPGPILDPSQHSVHLVAGLLKFYLRELPEPLIPFRFYDRLKATGFRIADGQDLTPLIDILESLPAPNYHLLQYLCQFLYEVSQHEQSNRMSIENLASVFAPNFLRQADGDLDVEMAVSSIINLTIAEFIRQHERLFRLELVPLQQLHSSNSPVSGKRASRPRTRHTLTSSEKLSFINAPLAYPDILLHPAFTVDKGVALSDGELLRRRRRSSEQPFNRKDLPPTADNVNQPISWQDQSAPEEQFDRISPSVIAVRNYATPPVQNNSVQLSTSCSEPSYLRRITQPNNSDYDCEDSYSTPTTLSSEVIDSGGGSGSLRLLNRDKQLQSSGFISCFDCPTAHSFSVGTRSPPSSSKFDDSDKLERRPSFWAQSPKNQIHRITSFNGDSSMPHRHTVAANRTSQHGPVRQDPDAIDSEIPPKPPPFSLTMSDSRSPEASPMVTLSQMSAITQHSSLNNPQIKYSTTMLNRSPSHHVFDAPSCLKPADQIGYWRSMAISSRADAAGQRAWVRMLNDELNRVQIDLNMARLEIVMLRERLNLTEAKLNHEYPLDMAPVSNPDTWTYTWHSR